VLRVVPEAVEVLVFGIVGRPTHATEFARRFDPDVAAGFDDPQQLDSERSSVRNVLENVASDDEIAAVIRQLDAIVGAENEACMLGPAGGFDLVDADEGHAVLEGRLSEDPAEAADVNHGAPAREIAHKFDG
jgi:hypothetical protein